MHRKANDEDKARLLHEVRMARMKLAESGLLKKPADTKGRLTFEIYAIELLQSSCCVQCRDRVCTIELVCAMSRGIKEKEKGRSVRLVNRIKMREADGDTHRV